MAKDPNSTVLTQAITKDARIHFYKKHMALGEVTLKHDIPAIDRGPFLDKLILKFADQITMEDFYPDKFKGNELK